MRPWNAIIDVFKGLMSHPGEFLSLDEGMAQVTSTRNPIDTSLGKAKPLEGLRMFLLVDYFTKVIINGLLDDKSLSTENCAQVPGGMPGAFVEILCTTRPMPGEYYKVMIDNFYASLALVLSMLNLHKILVGGTLQKKNVPKEILFGDAKKPKTLR
jgi:hypothetical protein